MFEATFVGHQGWLLESEGSRVLVDPLLADGLGNMPDDVMKVYPPRRLDLAAFPPVDAVVVTHEHPDHLSIPSLLRLDPSVPILLSGRASDAARGLLAELGFVTTPLRSGEKVLVGALEVHPFHCTELTRDEWDVTPVVVRDRRGDGSFATSIDAPESLDFARFAVSRVGRPGIWASSHNHMDLFPQHEGAAQERDDATTARLARDIVSRFEKQFPRAPRPALLALFGSGFGFFGELAWMNRHVFPGHIEAIAPIVAARVPDVPVRTPLPGNRWAFTRGAIVEETESRDFLGTPQRDEWPPHSAEPCAEPVTDYAPATGRRDADVDALLVALRGFAEHLYGRELHEKLYARADEVRIGFSVRTESGAVTLAYRPSACTFERVDAPARAVLAAGLECWAADLLAVLRCELVAGYMLLGRVRSWSRGVECDLETELSLYAHPLRHPERTLALYRTTIAALRASAGTARVPRA